MADEGGGVPPTGDSGSRQPRPQIHMELRDSLPGGRAVVTVEQEGRLTMLASKEHITAQAAEELADQLGCIARNWSQNWPGR
ncbi:hypothetical protein [Streptomyces sp. NPDC001492]